MATKQEENLGKINQGLFKTLETVREINRSPLRLGQTRINLNLERELGLFRLMTNEPE